ncbi:MAG: PadR family transcriptional regulator [Sporichthyaceae bacterium]|nr:PadR family transcriptional regulator [Sporichthyaceae bacterium]
MAKRRKVNNLLALAVLSSLFERPMHPYEMVSVLKERGKDQSMKINWGSLYTVVQNLEKHGFIEATSTTRQGRRPERTVYELTEAGRDELLDWMRELVGVPDREYPKFEAALSVLGVLGPDEAIDLLQQRLRHLDRLITAECATLDHLSQELPRLFLIEAEYALDMRRAEATWVRALLADLADGSLPGVAEWRHYHETGELPPEMKELADRGRPLD